MCLAQGRHADTNCFVMLYNLQNVLMPWDHHLKIYSHYITIYIYILYIDEETFFRNHQWFGSRQQMAVLFFHSLPALAMFPARWQITRWQVVIRGGSLPSLGVDQIVVPGNQDALESENV